MKEKLKNAIRLIEENIHTDFFMGGGPTKEELEELGENHSTAVGTLQEVRNLINAGEYGTVREVISLLDRMMGKNLDLMEAFDTCFHNFNDLSHDA